MFDHKGTPWLRKWKTFLPLALGDRFCLRLVLEDVLLHYPSRENIFNILFTCSHGFCNVQSPVGAWEEFPSAPRPCARLAESSCLLSFTIEKRTASYNDGTCSGFIGMPPKIPVSWITHQNPVWC